MQPDDNKNIASSGFTQQSETQRVMSRNTIIQTSIDEKEKGASLGSRIGASIVGPIENNSSIYNNTQYCTGILFLKFGTVVHSQHIVADLSRSIFYFCLMEVRSRTVQDCNMDAVLSPCT